MLPGVGAPAGDHELHDVLWAQLGPRVEAAHRPEVLTSLQRLVRRRRPAPGPLPEVAALFAIIGVLDSSELDAFQAELAEVLAAEPQPEALRAALPAVFQSYVRAVGRVVAAEAGLGRQLLLAAPPAERRAALQRALGALLPLSSRGFDVLHRALLLEAMVEMLEGQQLTAPDDTLTVGMVDVVSSTELLVRSAPADVERFVDVLFEAAQLATAARPVHVVKHVGDGVFLGGRDTAQVADACLALIAQLEDRLPLRVRGGLDHGPVVERAGDLFGLPINMANHLTKAARPGGLLASEAAARALPADRRGHYKTLTGPHPALEGLRVAPVRPPG